MPANLGWDEYVLDGGDNENWLQPYKPKEFEMLFEVGQDPYELKNLAFDNVHKAKLVEMRSVLSKHIREIGDLGFFPESTRDKGTDLYGWVRRSGYDLEALHDAAEKASEAKPYYKTNFIEYLNSEYPSIRFWGATGLANFASQNPVSPDACPTDLQSALQDKNKQVAAVAAEACCYFGRYDIGMKYLIDSIVQKDPYAGTSLETISWYDRQREEIMKYKDVLLQNVALQKVRAVLVNLKLMPVSELYIQKDKAKGIAVNVDRRKLVPTP